jgi:dihydrolipoamide dehydrogenase
LANGETFDLVVIGSGPGGYVGAIRAAQMGLKTAVVERDPAGCGGTCLQRGCIPTKALLHTADLYEDLKNGKEYGIVAEKIGFDFPALMARKARIVSRLSKGIEATSSRRTRSPSTRARVVWREGAPSSSRENRGRPACPPSP